MFQKEHISEFQDLRELQCDLKLADIKQNLTSSADLETLAASAQMLTSQPEDLTAEEVTTAAQIADTLLSSVNVSQSVREAAVATVNQIIYAGAKQQQRYSQTLSSLSVDLSLISDQFDSKLVQPNIAIQSAQIAAADTRESSSPRCQVTIISQSAASQGTSGSFVADRIQLNTPAVTVETDFIADTIVHLKFPQTLSNVSVGFVLYQNDHFFRSRRYRRRRASVRVLSAKVSGVEPQQVQMLFRPMSFRENYEYAEELDTFSIVGLTFSILGLVVTIIHHITDKSEQKNYRNSQLALLSIWLSLLAFIITFLSGVTNRRQYGGDDDALLDTETNGVLDSDEHVAADGGPCSVVTALLHFFLLATFTWNSVYATQLVLLFRKNLPLYLPYWTLLSATIGWALDKSKDFDFGKPMFWGFLLPIGLILIYNIVLLVLVSRKDTAFKSIRKFLNIFSLAVLLGLSWTLGYLVLVTTGTAHLVLSILFCLCNTTQVSQI
ncbi:hypothetical protein EPR50_G00235060 [Perca flavescens]|uniref:G-protein coupled receptors family 2 profile 2 domain-containing protein n=1 Tax=Perca flavescens TaxID=8167 RepID=A0A484C4R0_PERFV|nr:hypothetical protein EPR50_G00235060 [Perca flavescens]